MTYTNPHKPIFLVYDARSGSTLLASILSQFKGISVVPESNFPIRIIKHGPCKNSEEVDALLDYLYDEEQFSDLSIEKRELKQKLGNLDFPINERDLIDTVIDLCTPQDSKNNLLVIKCSRALFNVQVLKKIYPDLRLLHICRDGRAVFSSKRSSITLEGRPFNRSVLNAARHWVHRLKLADKYRGFVLDEIRYEDLVLDQDATLEKYFAVLGIPINLNAKEKDISAYADRIGSNQKRLHKNVGKEIDKNRLNAWREKLTEDEIYAYERYAYRYLSGRNYELTVLGSKDSFKAFVTIYLPALVSMYFEIVINLLRRIK